MFFLDRWRKHKKAAVNAAAITHRLLLESGHAPAFMVVHTMSELTSDMSRTGGKQFLAPAPTARGAEKFR